MQVLVAGKQVQVSQALRQYINDQWQVHIDKLTGSTDKAEVYFGREGSFFRADISMHFSRRLLVQSHGVEATAYGAFDLALGRLAKRLRRTKRKSRSGLHRAAGEHEELAIEDRIGNDLHEDGPLIIANMDPMETLSLREAAERLHTDDSRLVCVFRNAAGGAVNVVLRRSDGHIVWYEPGLVDKPT